MGDNDRILAVGEIIGDPAFTLLDDNGNLLGDDADLLGVTTLAGVVGLDLTLTVAGIGVKTGVVGLDFTFLGGVKFFIGVVGLDFALTVAGIGVKTGDAGRLDREDLPGDRDRDGDTGRLSNLLGDKEAVGDNGLTTTGDNGLIVTGEVETTGDSGLIVTAVGDNGRETNEDDKG